LSSNGGEGNVKRILLIIAAIAVMLPAGAGAAGATRSKVTIEAFQLATSTFYGYVDSPKKRCKDQRKVQLYVQREGEDERLGADRAELEEDRYTWFIPIDHEIASYYAKIKPRDGCKGDRSDSFFIPF
jgi:hypothetical protein